MWTLVNGEPPENLVMLEVADEKELHALLVRAGPAVAFHEPDLGGQLTAVAICHERAEKFLSNLPLAFKRTFRY